MFVWFALRELLTTGLGLQGGWYLIIMGAVAMGVSVLAPRGLWGLVLQHRAERVPKDLRPTSVAPNR